MVAILSPLRSFGTNEAYYDTKSQVFSALIDKRAYKPAMSGRDAYQIMLQAEGHLDMDLVAAFEPVAASLK